MRPRLWLWKALWPWRARSSRNLRPGSVFPDFALEDTAGWRHELSDNPERRLTVLWFTNLCEDCRERIPLLREVAAVSGRDFRVWAVSILAADDPLARREAPGCGFPVLVDPDDIVAHELGLSHPPGTCPLHNLFILDADGRILLKRHLSAIAPEEFREAWRGLAAARRRQS
ncbi:MAG: redoxin domain-containing protein [Elusimicrobia bacterium]|nr:redoxin domain-containing protein [Elusimicrobiota bacterium]